METMTIILIVVSVTCGISLIANCFLLFNRKEFRENVSNSTDRTVGSIRKSKEKTEKANATLKRELSTIKEQVEIIRKRYSSEVVAVYKDYCKLLKWRHELASKQIDLKIKGPKSFKDPDKVGCRWDKDDRISDLRNYVKELQDDIKKLLADIVYIKDGFTKYAEPAMKHEAADANKQLEEKKNNLDRLTKLL